MYSKIDDVDLKILDLLEKEGFQLTNISSKTGLSRFTLSKRIKTLFKKGIIRRPTIVVNPFASGNKRIIFFEFKTNPHEPWIAEFLAKIENCEALVGVTGEYSLFARFKFKNSLQFNKLLRGIDEMMSRSVFKKYHFIDVIQCFKENHVIFEEEIGREVDLDNLDYKILHIMQNQDEYGHRHRPLTTMEVSRILKRLDKPISQPSVFRRLKRLKKEGVILRNTVDIDYDKLGFQTRFVLKLKVNPIVYDRIARGKFVFMKEITDLYRTSEDYGLLAMVQVRNVHEYNEFLIKLYDSKSVIDTFSTLILEERRLDTKTKL